MTGRLAGKSRATGGSSGIGLGIATCFARKAHAYGSPVAAKPSWMRRSPRLAATPLRSRATRPSSATSTVYAHHPGPSPTHRRAGGECRGLRIRHARTDHRGAFRQDVQHEFRGLLFTVQKALPLLSRGSSVILTGSMVSIKGFAACSVYNASKAAVRSFARTWTVDLKGRDIRINVLSPGYTDTPGLSHFMTDEQKVGDGRLGSARPDRPPDDLGKAAGSSLPTTAPMSPVSSCSWTVARGRSEVMASAVTNRGIAHLSGEATMNNDRARNPLWSLVRLPQPGTVAPVPGPALPRNPRSDRVGREQRV